MEGLVNVDKVVDQLESLENVIASTISSHDSMEYTLKVEKKKQGSYENQISAFQGEIKKLHDVITGYQRSQEDLCNIRDENISLKKELNGLLRKIDDIREDYEDKLREMQCQINKLGKEHEMQLTTAVAEARFENEEKLQSFKDQLNAREAKVLELNTKIQHNEEENKRRYDALKLKYDEESHKVWMYERTSEQKSNRLISVKEQSYYSDVYETSGPTSRLGYLRGSIENIPKSVRKTNSPRRSMIMDFESEIPHNPAQIWRGRTPYRPPRPQTYISYGIEQVTDKET